MHIVLLILALLALVFLAMAALAVPTRRLQWGWLGLLCLALYVFAPILGGPLR